MKKITTEQIKWGMNLTNRNLGCNIVHNNFIVFDPKEDLEECVLCWMCIHFCEFNAVI